MPIPRKQFTPEEIEAGRKLMMAARDAGAVESHHLSEFPIGTKTEIVCVDKQRGTLVDPNTFQPTTPDAWVANCKQRGVLPTIPNL